MVKTYRAPTNIALNTPPKKKKSSIIFKYFLISFNAVFLQSIALKSSVKPSNALTGPDDDIFPPIGFRKERTEQFSEINSDLSLLSVDQEQVHQNQWYKFLIYTLV